MDKILSTPMNPTQQDLIKPVFPRHVTPGQQASQKVSLVLVTPKKPERKKVLKHPKTTTRTHLDEAIAEYLQGDPSCLNATFSELQTTMLANIKLPKTESDEQIKI